MKANTGDPTIDLILILFQIFVFILAAVLIVYLDKKEEKKKREEKIKILTKSSE